MSSIRIQNVVAGSVFALFLLCTAAMALLARYPASDWLWYLNINYAREARPVLELLDYLPFAGLYQNMLIIAAMIALCALAVHRNCRKLTTATSHVALYAMGFAVIASSGRSLGSLQATNLIVTDVPQFAAAMDTGQMTMSVLLGVSLVSCLAIHCQIITELARACKRS